MSTIITETSTSSGHLTLNPPPSEKLENGPDLDAYDEEQVRLMEERCILVNEKDEAYGEESKKTCQFLLYFLLLPRPAPPLPSFSTVFG